MYLAIFSCKSNALNLGTTPSPEICSMSVQKLDHGEPFNLTGDVTSDVPLTSLFWSPTEYSAPLRGIHNRTITFHYGNIATTFMLLMHQRMILASLLYLLLLNVGRTHHNFM